MSIELELEEDGNLRVRIDRDGERAVSDTIDPWDLVVKISETMNPPKEETSA